MALPPTYDDLPDKRRYWPATPGSYDEGVGMLRLLTPEVVAAAAQSEIRTGQRVCLNWDLSKLDYPGFGRQKFSHKVQWVAEGHAFDDVYSMNPQQSSQWDGLRHHSGPDPDGKPVWYGGTTAEEIQDPSNSRLGMSHWAKQGIAGRGVLIDYLAYAERKGISVNGLSHQVVSLEDVLAIAKECNITFKTGDIFFLRVGFTKTWDGLEASAKEEYSKKENPHHAGLEQSERVVRFLWDNHFSAVASDAVSFEVFPQINQEWNLHHILLAGWGVPIGEMFDLEGLAALCENEQRWTFFVSSSPLNCAQGVSSPPNCMAIM
ncbi:hypothetical protein BX600DRAFT_475342 [Xylariales sp. PMI_506]|nr:hypothetical protein BX600DRAFT_475342 [Xylariales sp. PMI_506]